MLTDRESVVGIDVGVRSPSGSTSLQLWAIFHIARERLPDDHAHDLVLGVIAGRDKLIG